MTVQEASTLDLQPAGSFKLSLEKGLGVGDAYGLDRNGKRVWFSSMGDFDKKTIAQFAQQIQVVCAGSFASAKMKASDGQTIRLVFRPTIRDGKGIYILSQIDRQLPDNMSPSELKSFTKQAREKYGTAFVADRSGMVGVTKPSAMVHSDFAMGRSLRLVLPVENLRSKLMEQPGCSDQPRLE